MNFRNDKYGDTALTEAARKNNNEIVEALIKAGANLDVQSNAGWTALILATKRGAPRVAKTLLNAGANTGLRDKYGKTALDYAKGNSSIRYSDVYYPLKQETLKRIRSEQ
ncbi:MAG: ankyrin repeat domain-containing protein [Desulfobacterales bacterium]